VRAGDGVAAAYRVRLRMYAEDGSEIVLGRDGVSDSFLLFLSTFPDLLLFLQQVLQNCLKCVQPAELSLRWGLLVEIWKFCLLESKPLE